MEALEGLFGIIGAIDMIIQSPGAGLEFSIMGELMGLLDKVAIFAEEFNIIEALGALGIL